MSDAEKSSPLQRAAAEFNAAIAAARNASKEASESLNRLRTADATNTSEYKKLEEDVAKRFRSGKYGNEIRELQRHVDSGKMSWQQIRDGSVDQRLSRVYRENQTAILDAIMSVRQEATEVEQDPSNSPSNTDDDWAERSILRESKRRRR